MNVYAQYKNFLNGILKDNKMNPFHTRESGMLALNINSGFPLQISHLACAPYALYVLTNNM